MFHPLFGLFSSTARVAISAGCTKKSRKNQQCDFISIIVKFCHLYPVFPPNSVICFQYLGAVCKKSLRISHQRRENCLSRFSRFPRTPCKQKTAIICANHPKMSLFYRVDNVQLCGYNTQSIICTPENGHPSPLCPAPRRTRIPPSFDRQGKFCISLRKHTQTIRVL